jgi:hypothetical protein
VAEIQRERFEAGSEANDAHTSRVEGMRRPQDQRLKLCDPPRGLPELLESIMLTQ